MDARALLADLRRKKKKTGLLVDPEPEIQHGILSSIGRGAKTVGANVMRGLLGDTSPEQTAMMARFIERPDYYGEMVNPAEAMETGATSALLATPVVGDIAGAAMDAHMYATDPASRTPFNFALSGLGVLPMIPAASQVKAARDKIKAFHGSPHDFPPVRELEMPDGAVVYQSMGDAVPDGARVIKEHPLGRFDMSKIGTGEGAQAYGHGLYFADSEDVARGYRDRIAGSRYVDNRGVTAPPNQIANDIIDQAARDGLSAVEANRAANGWSDVLRDGGKAKDTVGYSSIKKVLDDKGYRLDPKGRMYEVEIDATPDELLDWDLPLSEQSEVVRGAVESAFSDFPPDGIIKNMDGSIDLDAGGRTVYESLATEAFNSGASGGVGGNHAKYANSPLRAAGIKGIKYKDGFSRGAEGGTSNYVIFDDRLISIAKKYGVSIPVAAAILTRMTGKDATNGYQEAET